MFISCNTAQNSNNIIVLNYKEFKEKVIGKNVQLIDVRTVKEYKTGFIDGAILIDFLQTEQFKKQIELLDKNKSVYIYCRSGKRSAKASELFIKQGFTKVYDLSGGYKSWVKNK